MFEGCVIHLKKCIHMMIYLEIRCLMLIFYDSHDKKKTIKFGLLKKFEVIKIFVFFTTFFCCFFEW